MLVDDARLARLSGATFGRLIQLDQTGSTNAVVVERARQGEPEGLVVVADFQTAGRGRLERRWEAPPGTCLLFSVLMRPGQAELPVPRRHLAVAALSLAIADAVSQVAGVALELKWPNDLVVGPAKVGGVLAGTTGGTGEAEAVVVGAGINVAWAPPGLPATSVKALAQRDVDRAELLVVTLVNLGNLYGCWDVVGRRYRDECATVGRDVVVQRGPGQPDLVGQALAIDDDGHLVVGVAHGMEVTVAAGDVVHARPARGTGGH